MLGSSRFFVLLQEDSNLLFDYFKIFRFIEFALITVAVCSLAHSEELIVAHIMSAITGDFFKINIEKTFVKYPA